MAQLGIADTLKLLAAGYKKKDIDAMAALDDKKDPEPDTKKDPEPDDKKDPEPDTKLDDKKDPEPDTKPDDKKDPEPDYKKLFEESQTKQKELEEKIKKIQKDNINNNNQPEYETKKQDDINSLKDALRSFY